MSTPRNRLDGRSGARSWSRTHGVHRNPVPNLHSNIATTGTWSYRDLIFGMNQIDEIVAQTESCTFPTPTEMDGLCNKFSRLCIDAAPSKVAKTKTRLGWLLSRLPSLTIELDPSMTRSRLRKFELFMQLPAEIRIMIWDLIAFAPRKVKLLECSIKPYQHSSVDWNSNVEGQARQPAILQICCESRLEGLARHYTKCQDRLRYVAYKNNPTKMGSHMSNTFYINFDRDIFIHGSSQFDTKDKAFPGDHGFNFEPHVLKKIQKIEQRPCYRVAWQTYFDLWEGTLFDAVIFRTSIWESLKEVNILHHDYSRYWDTDAVGFDKARRVWEKSSKEVFESFPNFPGSALSMFSTPLRSPLRPLKFALHFKWKRSEVAGYKTIACASQPDNRYPKDPTERAAAQAADRTRSSGSGKTGSSAPIWELLRGIAQEHRTQFLRDGVTDEILGRACFLCGVLCDVCTYFPLENRELKTVILEPRILSALAGITSTAKDLLPSNDLDLAKDTPEFTGPSSLTPNCVSLSEALAKAHLLKEKILAQHRIRMADTSRVRPLLSALPPLFIGKMPIPTCPPLEKFELFEKLPKDVRMMIYSLMVAEPRCIKLFEGYTPNDRHIHLWNSNVECQSRHPAIVDVSQEARQEGLRFYTICQDRRRLYIELTLPEPHETWRTEESRLLDYFDHGESKFRLSSGSVAGPEDFNFKVDVLEQVKHQESLWWAAGQLKHEKNARVWLKDTAASSLVPGGLSIQEYQQATEVIGPLQFQINFKWKWQLPYQGDVDRYPYVIRPQTSDSGDPAVHQRRLEVDRETLEHCAETYRIRGD
ncbi:hypothetical protein DL98DRAFT_619247 [Cadophora sp. DSE1049]|nr:hypothetical protein DL98DRAFT_619247 [Cadophora sp. DSE1049]